MGLSCKSKSAIAVCNSTRDVVRRPRTGNGTLLENFKFRDLESATNWFSRENLILQSSHGHLYRATLPDGRVVVVKRPDPSQRHHEEAFDNEVHILSKLFSRRLVNLLGCSRDGRATLLVLEYMENGPLLENLTDPAVSLSWPMRVKLAVDIAKAVRALHASSPPIVHCNLRSTNIFLDRDGRARLGDFGVAKILNEQAEEPPRRSALISIPELGTEEDYGRHSSAGLDDFDVEETSSSSSESRISPKTDVYSFGILLLEIISGRPDPPRELLNWALPLIKHGHSMAICDPSIAPFPDNVAVRIMANTASRCVRSSSARRPAMEEVVQSLTKASKLVPEPLWAPTASFISTPGYPVLTPSSTTSRDFKSGAMSSTISSRDFKSGSMMSNTMSRRREKLINANLDAGHTPFNAEKSSSSATAASGFPNLKKKKMLVFRVGRFLVRKLRIARRVPTYDKLPVTQLPRKRLLKSATSRSPLKGAKVSDDLDLEVFDIGLQKIEPKKPRNVDKGKPSRFPGYYSSGTHRRSQKSFVKL